MRTIIAGGRDYNFNSKDEEFLDSIADSITEVVEGGATGADTCARYWATKRGIPTKTFHADWWRNGMAAGPIRNREMAEYAKNGQCILFPGGKGTDSMCSIATSAGLKVIDKRRG